MHNRKPKILTFLCLLLLLVYISSFNRELNFATEHFKLVTKDGEYDFDFQIADTAQKRAHGLMYITQMDDNKGMLFVYPEPSLDAFWMKNTYISLDFLFLDENMSVMGKYENAIPLDEYISIRAQDPISYAIEINAGLIKKLGIGVGDYLVKK